MPIHNSEIADIFDRLADLLEIEGENAFRVRAYRNAARTISGLPKSAADMLKEKEDFSELPGIGKDLAAKIEEIVKTGKLAFLEKVQKSLPSELGRLMEIQGLGPRRIKTLYDTLKIKSIAELKKAARTKKIRELPGFGEKIEEDILREIERVLRAEGLLRLDQAEEIGISLLEYLKKTKGVKKAVIAGSYRRAKETVRDLDMLVACEPDSKAMDSFINHEDVDKVISHGDTRSTVILRSGVQVDLRVVPEKSYGAALLYFTGSKAHNIAVRKIAVRKGLKINEYGVFRKVGEKRTAGKTEEEVYREIGLPFIEPELREDRGEIEAARKGKLPHLITLEDIRGDLHTHTNLTDGHASLAEMVEAAKVKGYEYIGITEHSKHVTIAHGLEGRAVLKQIKEIDRFNEKVKGITALKGIEVDILEDGSLDMEDEVLKELDFTVCAIHYKFNLPSKKQTERIIRAMDNPYFNILAHPTGRLINERDPYEVDMEQILKAAKERKCVIELSAHPYRLDLNDVHCKMAKDMGLKIVISTDSHNTGDLDFMRYGVLQARRGWLEPGDVINTRGLENLRKLLKRK